MNEFFYQAEQSDGGKRQGSVIATDVADARFQLTRMGMREIRILSSASIPMQITGSEDADIAAMAVQAQFDSLPRAVLRIFTGNAILWLPLAGFAAWSLYQGKPYSYGDYTAFALFALGIAFVVLLALPVVLYQQILWARIFGQYRRGLFYYAIFQRVNLFLGLPAIATGVERCKLLAALGQHEQAQREFNFLASDATPKDRLIHGIALADARQDRETMMRLQREFCASHPETAEPKVDLAMSIARYTNRADEAEALINGVHSGTLPESYAAALGYVRGLIAQSRGDHARAVDEFAPAIKTFLATNNPIAFAIATEIRGYLAISLKALGKTEQAEAIWKAVWPILQHHGCESMQQRYTGNPVAQRAM